MSKELKKWMPMFWGEYFAKTKHLTCLQHGAYMQLIGYYWLKGKLPNDDRLLARIVGVRPNLWHAEIRQAMGEFFNTDWTHDRVEAELAYAIEKSKRLSANAKLRLSNGRASAGASADTPTPTPTPTKKERKIYAPRGAEFEKFWSAYPRKKAKKAAEKAFEKAIKESSIASILHSLAIDAAEWKDEKFTPFPATWLNRGSYLDHAETAEKRTYRPPGVTDANQSEATQRPTATVSKLLDAGARIPDEKPSGVGVGGSFQPGIRTMGEVLRPTRFQTENARHGRSGDDSNEFGSDEST